MVKYLFSLFLIYSANLYAENFYLTNILQMDNKYSHHVLLVEKSTHQLFLYKNSEGHPELLKTYKIATGKLAGNKTDEGDKKTPEGIYQLIEFYPQPKLKTMYGAESKIYGAGAFTTNYPNVIDQRNGKSGSGIWLHSTDDDSRIEKGLDSRGCVVVVDKDLKDIANYIDLTNTPMIIVHDRFFLSDKTWNDQKLKINELINGWKEAWSNEDIQSYISYYHPTEFKDSKGNYNAYKAYKTAVFSNPGKPRVDFTNVSILAFNDYVMVQMEQKYLSNTINDSGKKILFLKKNQNYEWKIITEHWSKIPDNKEGIFTPSQRFF